MEKWGYVFATSHSNSENSNLLTICFCSNIDTAPDCSGTNVKPIVHKNYSGAPIILPDDTTQIITTERHSYLREKIGEDIITASGLTLLGADDKAGLAIIMDLATYLTANPGIKHGPIRILFTPDEEVGRGVEHLDMKKLGADYGYTLDGGKLGDIEDETFSADAVKIVIHGISAHPGYAKNKMINELKVSAEFVTALPKNKRVLEGLLKLCLKPPMKKMGKKKNKKPGKNFCHHGGQDPAVENSFNLDHGLRSGNFSCVMRYDNVGAVIRGYNPEAIGSALCSSPAGTEYNIYTTPNGFGAAAAKRGNCKGQIRVSGKVASPKSCGNR